MSTQSTGWCIGDDNNKLIDYGCIQSAHKNTIKRIIVMRDNIKSLILQNNIQKLVIEEVHADYNNSHTTKVLQWLQGVIQVLAQEVLDTPIEVEFIEANTWRTALGIKVGRGIKRTELKEKDIQYVHDKYNIEANDDICDAICLHDSYYTKKNERTCAW